MDSVFYLSLIEETMGVVSTGTTSIAKQSETLIANYLQNNTGITDDEKAKIYAKFLTDITISTTAQAIGAATQLALEGPVNDQKIVSMQNDDIVKMNEVAVKIAKAKIEIEQLIPSQVDMNRKTIEIQTKELLLKSAEIAIKEGQLLVEQAKVPLLEAQALNEAGKVNLTLAQTALEQAKVPLLEAQTNLEKSKVRLQKAEMALRYADVYYRQQQAQAVANSLVVNERIEVMKSETQLKIATIQASSI